MKTDDTLVSNDKTKASLHQLVDQVIQSSHSTAEHNRNSTINNVPLQFYVTANDDTVASVINGILRSVILNATDSVVYITAKEWYGNMIEVNIKDDQCYNTYAVALGLQDFVSKAEAIGGQLDITNQRQKITTVSFRFPS